jgi:prolipoprotein diacylglyceryltransferase
LIYTIAAYSITVGTLALYGVFMQHRGHVYSDLIASSSRSASVAESTRGFNMGAALLAPFWLWKHGMRAPGGVLIIMCAAIVPLYERELWVPLLFVAMVPVAAGAALGFVGNRIAMNHRRAESLSKFSASQLPWAIAGVCLFAIVLPWLWYFST